MFVDTALLRMGADFSDSAGAIARRGAAGFASTAVPTGIFGSFDEADQFQRTLAQTHASHSQSMQAHHGALTKLAGKAVTAATVFIREDEQGASALNKAQRTLDV